MQQPPYADPEDPEAKGFEFNDQSIRKGFIRKVFSILTVSNDKTVCYQRTDSGNGNYYSYSFQVQLLVTIGFVCLFIFHQPTQVWVTNNSWLWIVSLVVLVVTMIVLACCDGVRRKSPVNIIILGIFTLAMSFMLGVMSASFDIFEVLLALGVTIF